MPENEITLKLYSPLKGDFFPQEVYDDMDWLNRVGPDEFSGFELADYEESVQSAITASLKGTGGNLMPYFDKEQNPGVKTKVLSAVPSVEIRNGELMGCTTVKLRESLTDAEMKDFQDYLKGQFSDGWGEGFEQREIQTGDGVLYVHFGEEPFDFEVEQVRADPTREQTSHSRPKMKLIGEDGNIFAILGRASKLLRENGQPGTITGRFTSSVNMWRLNCQKTYRLNRKNAPNRSDNRKDDASEEKPRPHRYGET